MAPRVCTNKYKGVPGTSSFTYKVPKGITVSSIEHTIWTICQSLQFQEDIDTNSVSNDLNCIYPDLNQEIGRHFVLRHVVEGTVLNNSAKSSSPRNSENHVNASLSDNLDDELDSEKSNSSIVTVNNEVSRTVNRNHSCPAKPCHCEDLAKKLKTLTSQSLTLKGN